MRILLVNPNMTSSMTDQMALIARRYASQDTEIIPVTAPRGFPYISSRAEAQISGALVLEMIAELEHEVDAVIIAAFGDPGLKAAKELFNLPIIGIAEAALVTASLLGERFSIVTFTPAMTRWYVDSVVDSGLGSRFTGVRTPPLNALDAFDSQKSMSETLLQLVTQSIEEDASDVVILGGAPLSGMAHELQADANAILLDPITSAISLAEGLAHQTSRKGFLNRHSRPLKKTSVDLPPALTRAISREKK